MRVLSELFARLRAAFWSRLAQWGEPRLDLPLAMFRWVLGIALIVSYGQLVLDYDTYFSRVGMCPRAEWRHIVPPHSLSYFHYIRSDAVCKAIALAGLVPMALFWWGIFPRAMALTSFYVLVSAHDRCPLILDGADFVLRLMLFFFIFARSDRRLSPIAPVAIADPTDSFPIRLMQAQLCLIYLTTGLQKIYGVKWQNGTALAYTVQLDSFSRGDFRVIAENPVFVNFATYGTLAFEIGFIFVVWPRATRAITLLSGVALHMGIEALMYIPMFSWVMVSTYLTFIEPSWGETWLAAIAGPYRRWAKRRGYAVELGARDAIVAKLDVLGAVTWGTSTESAQTELRLTRPDGAVVRGFGAWARLATCVPSLVAFLPILALPGGAKLTTIALTRAARP